VVYLRRLVAPPDDDDDDGLDLRGDPETAWQVYRLMEAFDYAVLPHAGGLLDQEEGLMHDVAQLVRLKHRYEQHKAVDEALNGR
jgi:hypothetical protein